MDAFTEQGAIGSFISKVPLDIPVEQFLIMLHIENRGKLDDMRFGNLSLFHLEVCTFK